MNHFKKSGFFLLMGAFLGASVAAAAAKGAKPPASSQSPAPTLTALAPASKTFKLPTPEEWILKTGLKPQRVEKKQEELELAEYREPDVHVLDTSLKPNCPEPRREPTFEIIFGQGGKVEALRNIDQSVCLPIVDAWKESILNWRYRPVNPGEGQQPALIRVTVRFGATPKLVHRPD